MAKRSKRKKSTKKKIHQRKGFILSVGIVIGIILVVSLYQVSVYFSTNESCMMCHVHPHVDDSWKLSVHVNNGSGVMVDCIDCHLPPTSDTWAHYTAKLSLGIKDVWGYFTKDTADINWDRKSELNMR